MVAFDRAQSDRSVDVRARTQRVTADAGEVGVSVLLPDQATMETAIAEPSSRLWDRLFALAVAAMLVLMLLRPLYIPVANGDHYLYLAEHLVRGELSVNDIPVSYSDVITWQGNKYLPFGPLPS